MGHQFNPYSADQRSSNAIDRKRERERHHMLEQAFKNADDLALRLTQRLIDNHIVETTSASDVRELFRNQLKKFSSMEDFDIQYKIAPLRNLVANPNFISLYLTQFIIEDLINNAKVQDVFGDDEEIYQSVESVLNALRLKED